MVVANVVMVAVGAGAVRLGSSAGATNQATSAIAVGAYAGQNTQGANAVSVGTRAGQFSQGANAIAIGGGAGNYYQSENSICLNASGTDVNTDGPGLYISPVTEQTDQANIVVYDPLTSKVTYSTASVSGNSVIANTLVANAYTFVDATGMTRPAAGQVQIAGDEIYLNQGSTRRISIAGSTGNVFFAANTYSGISVAASDPNFGMRVLRGGGDGATYATCNGLLGSWNGIGMHCMYDNTTRTVFDTRNGHVTTTGNVNSFAINARTLYGNVAGANATLTGFVSAPTSNFTSVGAQTVYANVVGNTATLTGNVDANYIIGNGRFLTGIVVTTELADNAIISVASGGTGVTTNSGSGNVVLSDFPVLNSVTFAGVTSGAVLSQLNAANVSTGTLAVARGGSGTTTSSGTGNVILSDSPLFNGIVTIGSTAERIDIKTGATGIVSHDYSVSSIFHHSSIAANFTCNLVNVPTTTSRSLTIALILIQGATPRMVSAVQIDGVAQTIRWANNVVPTGTANKTDVTSFSLIRANNTWIVLGQNTNHG